MTNPLQEAQRLGQSIWYDNMRRGLIESGELQRLIDEGVTGITSNPTIFEKAIASGADYDDALLALARAGKSATEIYEALAIEDIQAAADLLRPVYERTDGVDGYVSLEVSPHLAHDTEGTVAEARRLFATLERPNAMVKVPATPEGIPAIRRLIADGVNINVTLIFALEMYRQVIESYLAGLEDFAKAGGDLRRIASVASFFVSRVDTAVDALLEERGDEGRSLQGKAAVANAKLAYRLFERAFADARSEALRAQGARVQRPLWASTGTKNPAYSDVLYVETLLGPHTVNTMPPATLTAFMEHGNVARTVDVDVAEALRVIERIEALGIRMQDVTGKLLADGVKAFADSFDSLIANVEEKRRRLLHQPARPSASLGRYAASVDEAVAGLDRDRIVERIWQRDHTVWMPDPTEIADRLGWLDVTDTMRDEVVALERFADEVRGAGYRHVVLLGMGGSSLGPEVLRQTFGSREGYPELIVLDTTVPAWIKAVTEQIDPARTLFLVSSKSGGTIETLSLYKYFRSLVDEAVGQDAAGPSFVAITDAGTSLERLAERDGFRKAFLNPSDIGGRYSVLSYFGLVPAALIGVDLALLLAPADGAREACVSPSADANPGAWLGAAIGTLARAGRDKLTLVTSPCIAGFGLWAEQLIAESTGKEGRGVVPVAGEPLLPPDAYGDDRLFVYLRVDGDDSAATDQALAALEGAGRPVVRLALHDRYDLGAELFRWEFATAIAGHVLGIQPFDQPDVQAAKDLTGEALADYARTGKLPEASGSGSLQEALAQFRPGDYFAAMAYVQPTVETERALDALRRRVMQAHRVATTVGYGPRFLHSTGQLHKGGPNGGVFLQVTQEHAEDVAIPGERYTFGVLADAQAIGDLRALRERGRRVAALRLRAGDSLADLAP